MILRITRLYTPLAQRYTDEVSKTTCCWLDVPFTCGQGKNEARRRLTKKKVFPPSLPKADADSAVCTRSLVL